MTALTPLLRVAGVLLWLGLATAGLTGLASYAATPGATSEAPNHWPQASGITPVDGEPTLLLFLHPYCPCSSATLEGLNQLLAETQGRCAVHVLMTGPGTDPSTWPQTRNWQVADALPGVDVTVDAAGLEASRFGATTSGHVVAFDAQGTLRFTGGITPSRGHAGDNAGLDTIRTLLSTAAPSAKTPPASTPVFGCPLGTTPDPTLAGSVPCPSP